MNIGIIDSGVGGLSIYNKLKDKYNSKFFIDIANYPYGTKSKREVLKNINRLIKELKRDGYKNIIVACFTASVYINNPNIITMDKLIIRNIRKDKIYNFICTESTYKSSFLSNYSNVIKHNKQSLINKIENEEVIDEEIDNLNKLDNLILGCTHFNHIKEKLNNVAISTDDIILEYIEKRITK